MTDAAIVNRIRAGDWEAFALLVDRYRSAVYGLAFYHLSSVEDAQDVAQEAFLLAFRRLGQLQDADKFASWLRRITVNVCRISRRRPLPERLPDTLPVAGEMAARIETRVVVAAALNCLSPETRLTLTLFYSQGHSLAEIARFLDVPVTTVKSRLRDARIRLRKELLSLMEDTIKPAPLPADFTVRVMNSLKANGAIYHLAFSPDGRLLAHETYGYEGGAFGTGDILIWDVMKGALQTTLSVGLYISGLNWSPDGKTLVFGCSLGQDDDWRSEIRLLERQSGAVRTIGSVPDGNIRTVAQSPDGALLATGSNHKAAGSHWGEARVWNIGTGNVLWSARQLTHVLHVAFSPDSKLVATSGAEWQGEEWQEGGGWAGGDVRLWETATGQYLRTMSGPNATSHCDLVFSPDGKLLVTGYGREGSVLIWYVATGEIARTLTEHEDMVYAVTFSPDGVYLATGSQDRTVRIWEVQTGKLLRTLTGHEHPVHAVAFTPDSKLLASSDIAGVVKLWQID